MDLRVPVFSWPGDAGFQKRLNGGIAGIIDGAVREMKERHAVDAADAKEKGIRFWNHDLYARYTLTFNDEGILSFYLELYRYTGGAHGMTERIQYNVDLEACRLLTLRDLFEPDFDYVSVINTQVEKQIAARPGEFFREDGMRFRTIGVDQPFWIAREGIVVYFAPYQIAPYSTGFPEFPIPYGSLPIALRRS